jgi:glycosyltransferase involved in cell wall biosynthesis
MEAMKIFLVDSNAQFRANLRLYIEGYLHHKVVGEASDESGINGCKDLFADIILVNIDKSILSSAHKGINPSEFLGCKKIAMSQRREIIDTHVLIDAGYKGLLALNTFIAIGKCYKCRCVWEVILSEFGRVEHLCDGRDAIFIEKIYGISVVFGDTKILFKIFSMRVLMFGWEFPPHISGGLGTACYGLSSGLTSFDDVDLVFVVPKAYGDEPKPKMTLIGASDFELSKEVVSKYLELERSTRMEFQHQQVSAYITPEQYERLIQEEDTREKNFSQSESAAKLPFTGKYGGSLFDEISRYGIVASAIARKEPHDIIHAHDWLTYPAGIAAKEVSGKPLVVHVHATEFDRSGENINEKVYAIERKGMEVADRVITVSNLTRNIVIQRYGINPSKVITVYNAVDGVDNYTIHQLQRVKAKGKVVTFLGRITMQKGPEYFVEAANEVLKKKDDVQFVMAGSGDMMNRMIKLVAKKGIADRFFFPGS